MLWESIIKCQVPLLRSAVQGGRPQDHAGGCQGTLQEKEGCLFCTAHLNSRHFYSHFFLYRPNAFKVEIEATLQIV